MILDRDEALGHMEGDIIILNYRHILERIEKARSSSLLLSDEKVTLIAVSKGQSIEKIKVLLKQGHRHFAENRIQEALAKWPKLKKEYPDIVLHFIGTLQTNKIKEAVYLFEAIHIIDRKNLAEKIAKEITNQERYPLLFIQVNIGKEPQKSGIDINKTDDFIEYSINDLKLPIQGLMCIPPIGKSPEKYFKLLKEIAGRHELPYLSMGMSHDFEIAISAGATHVRIGTKIFGER